MSSAKSGARQERRCAETLTTWAKVSGGFFDWLGTTFRTRLDTIGETVGGFFSAFGTKVRGGLDAVGETFGGFFSGLGTLVRGGLDAVGEAVGGFFSALGTGARITFVAIGEAAIFGINAIIASIEAIPNAFIDGLNAVKQAWNAFSIRTPALEVLGRVIIPSITWDTPNLALTPQVALPRLAGGGIVPHTPGGRAVVVGEGGQDEAIVPLGRRGGGMGSRTIYLTVEVRVQAA